MRVLIAGGGTAGHINPAIAIAQYIQKQEKDAKILFAGTPFGMEANLVPKAGFDFIPIKVRGFQRSFSFQNLKRNAQALVYLSASGFRARKIVREFKPDIVIGTGGYASGPVVLAGAKLGIKTCIHEQNAFPGVTNKLLAKKVDMVFLAVREAGKKLPPCKTMTVGNPIRESIVLKDKRAARKELGLNDDFCILSFGGSLGARMINEIAADLMQWHIMEGNINHIHSTGKNGKDDFGDMLKARKVSIKGNPKIIARSYIDNMDTCLAAADIVVCRSGAITLSELEAAGKASILVPSPYVAENHQYHNAIVLVNNGAAYLIEEKKYNKEKLINMFKTLYNDRKVLEQLGKNASRMAIIDTTQRIYAAIKNLLQA